MIVTGSEKISKFVSIKRDCPPRIKAAVVSAIKREIRKLSAERLADSVVNRMKARRKAARQYPVGVRVLHGSEYATVVEHLPDWKLLLKFDNGTFLGVEPPRRSMTIADYARHIER